jgi:predicted AAA+ superfamily ATPase
MVAASICEKINPFGYEFTECARNNRYWENGKRVAEVDCFLENGSFVMPAEVKTELTVDDVEEHLERIAKIRLIMDKRDDARIIVGAVAGAIVPENVCVYA